MTEFLLFVIICILWPTAGATIAGVAIVGYGLLYAAGAIRGWYDRIANKNAGY